MGMVFPFLHNKCHAIGRSFTYTSFRFLLCKHTHTLNCSLTLNWQSSQVMLRLFLQGLTKHRTNTNKIFCSSHIFYCYILTLIQFSIFCFREYTHAIYMHWNFKLEVIKLYYCISTCILFVAVSSPCVQTAYFLRN